jgi:outer membrane immunogenic protein
MRSFRVLAAAFAAMAACGFSGAASAADGPSRWTGFYVGALAGYNFAKAPTTVTPNEPASHNVFDPYYVSSLEPHPHGVMGGIEAGYNAQFGPIVVGAATDLSFGSIHQSEAGQAPAYVGGQLTTTVDSKIDWFGSLRAKFGVLASDNLLLYATGGLAYGHVETTTTGSNTAGCAPKLYCVTGTSSETALGGIIGGGLEYAFAPHWSAKVEYLAMRLGSQSVTFSDPAIVGGAYTADTDFKMQVVRAGVAYRFGN